MDETSEAARKLLLEIQGDLYLRRNRQEHPQEEQNELLNNSDDVLAVGYPYTGRNEILDKLTPEDHSGCGAWRR